MNEFRVGLIGTGVISDIYLQTCQKFDILDVVACASLDVEESRMKAEHYQIPIPEPRCAATCPAESGAR